MHHPASRHIVLVGPAPPYRGGIAHFTEATARGLEARGHRVEVVTFSRQYPELLFPGKTQYAPGAASGAHVPPASAGAGSAHVPAARLVDSVNPLTWWRAGRHVARRRPDAVLFQHWMPFFGPAFGTMSRVVRRCSEARVLAVVHNALPHERHVGDRLLSRYFFSACDGFVVMSEAVGRDLRGLHVRAPVRRAEHPVYERFGVAPARDEARRRLGLPPEAHVLLFFGLVREYKGLRTLIEALPHVLEKLPHVHVVVAGEFYDDPAPYHALIRRHGLEEHVLLHNRYVPDAEVPHYFAAADVVVQPYRRATQSGVAQVAYHFEAPLIVTDVGGLAEVVPHGRAGLVVPPDDPPALAAAVIRYFEEDLRAPLAAGMKRLKAERAHGLYEAVEDLLGSL